uniref:LINE-1 type transposase domain-containing protein 1 n=1 Tax=Lygus hesperus TaxID=30085 RepID=A0A0A9VX54_LYGHE
MGRGSQRANKGKPAERFSPNVNDKATDKKLLGQDVGRTISGKSATDFCGKSKSEITNTDSIKPPKKPQSQPLPSIRRDDETLDSRLQNAVRNCLSTEDFTENIVAKLTKSIRDIVIDIVDRKTSFLVNKIDNLDQFNRRLNICMYGVPEDENKPGFKTLSNGVSAILNSKLVGDYALPNQQLIASAHRVGKVSNRAKNTTTLKPRPVIVSFDTLSARNHIIANKKLFKGSGIFICEDLTPTRRRLYRDLLAIHGPKNVWSSHGRVFWKRSDGGHQSATSHLEASLVNQKDVDKTLSDFGITALNADDCSTPYQSTTGFQEPKLNGSVNEVL